MGNKQCRRKQEELRQDNPVQAGANLYFILENLYESTPVAER